MYPCKRTHALCLAASLHHRHPTNHAGTLTCRPSDTWLGYRTPASWLALFLCQPKGKGQRCQTASRLGLLQLLQLVFFNMGSFGQTPSHRVLFIWPPSLFVLAFIAYECDFCQGLAIKAPLQLLFYSGGLYSVSFGVTIGSAHNKSYPQRSSVLWDYIGNKSWNRGLSFFMFCFTS